MKVSVFVPCMISHWSYLPKMIAEYVSGTVKPDEIVVCLSGADVLPERDKEMFERKYHGKVRLEVFDEHLYAGPARQKALELCDTDIIMYQDADDWPHRKRVEIVKYYFENRDIVALNHSYYFKGRIDRAIRIKDTKEIYGNELYDRYFPDGKPASIRQSQGAFGGDVGFPVHAGVVCVKPSVIEELPWRNLEELEFAPEPKNKTEDYEFCARVLHKYRNQHLIISAPVYFYQG